MTKYYILPFEKTLGASWFKSYLEADFDIQDDRETMRPVENIEYQTKIFNLKKKSTGRLYTLFAYRLPDNQVAIELTKCDTSLMIMLNSLAKCVESLSDLNPKKEVVEPPQEPTGMPAGSMSSAEKVINLKISLA